MAEEEEAEINRLPIDLLAQIFVTITSFIDLAHASSVCRRWRHGVELSLGRRERLSFAGLKKDDDSTSRIIKYAHGLKELDISKSSWACQITDEGLYKISLAKCIGNLTFISLWGMTGITDHGVVCLISKANSLKHLNIGATFITDESLSAVAHSCPHLRTIVLWCCRHVTQSGLLLLLNKCSKLESMDVWGTRVPPHCLKELLLLRPALLMKV